MEVNIQKIEEKAKSLGRALGQSDTVKALARAEDGLRDDEEVKEEFEKVQKLQSELMQKAQRGEEVSDEKQQELKEAMSTLEKRSEFQQFVAAQTNFEKLMKQVNQFIQQGISEGQDSKIVEI